MTVIEEAMQNTSARPGRPTGGRNARIVLAVVVLVGVAWSFSGLEISWARISGAPGDIWVIFKEMFPPNTEGEFVSRVRGKVFESVYIAWIATLIGAFFSLPLAFAAAGNTSPRWIQAPVRQLFNAIRAFPELILAVILLGVTGLGPWTGALAIGLHSIGTLGKLSTEAIESLDGGPMEATEAAGGRWVSKMRWGVLPQAFPIIVAHWLFRFEINIRASAVLGVVGAGGVGSELVNWLNFRQFDKAGTVLLMTIVVVIVIDTISASLRRRLILGGGRRPDDDDATMTALGDLTGIRPPKPAVK